MKKMVIICAAMLAAMPLFAQEAADAAEAQPEVKDWKWSGIVGVNATATGMVNWAAGGKNNVVGTAFGKVRCLYEKNSLSWDTNLDVEYGMSYVDQSYDKFQKSSDHLIFNTKFGWEFAKNWLLTVNAGFQTQFDLGRTYTGTAAPNPIVSNILAPSYTDISVGIDWKTKVKEADFSLYLSPVAGRITTAYVADYVQDDYADYLRDMAEYDLKQATPAATAAEIAAARDAAGDYDLRTALQEKNGTFVYTDNGDDGYTKEYKNAKAELGLTLRGSVNYNYKDFKLMSTVTLFTPYAWDKTELYEHTDGKIYSKAQMEDKGYALDNYLGYRDNNRRFGNFDVDWTVGLSYQFLKCLNVTLSTNLKYVNGLKIADKDGNNPVERVQFLANLGLGVSYAF